MPLIPAESIHADPRVPPGYVGVVSGESVEVFRLEPEPYDWLAATLAGRCVCNAGHAGGGGCAEPATSSVLRDGHPVPLCAPCRMALD